MNFSMIYKFLALYVTIILVHGLLNVIVGALPLLFQQ